MNAGAGALFEHQAFFRRYGRDRPAIDPLSILYCHIDAAMTMRMPKIVMPIGAVDGYPVLGDIRIPGYTG